MGTRISLTLLLLGLVFTAQPQTSSQEARQILGDHFVTFGQTLAAWQKIDKNLSSIDSVFIPYDGSTLEFFQAKTAKGEGDFYLVPTIGLSDNTLKKFWYNYSGIYHPDKKTEIVYRLINLKPPEYANSTGFKELSTQMLANNGQTMPVMDYLETVATIFLVTGKNLSPQFAWLMLSDDDIVFNPMRPLPDFQGEIVIAYSAIIKGDKHDVVISYFPRENFIAGSISNSKLTLLATENDKTESMIFVPLKDISEFVCEKDYFVGLCYYIRPTKVTRFYHGFLIQ